MTSRLPARRGSAPAFTMIELLTVIGVIVILVAILIPTIAAVRNNGYNVDSQQHIQVIAAACQRYYDDHRAYPGPVPNAAFGATGLAGNFQGTNYQGMTMSENLVVGLMGGWEPPTPGVSNTARFVEANVGTGPMSHNPNPNARRRTTSYIDVAPGNGLSQKPFTLPLATAGKAVTDSIVPEFMDKFPDPMPIVYLRARIGATGVVSTDGSRQYNRGMATPYADKYQSTDAFTVNTTDFPQGDADYFRNRQIAPTQTGDDARYGTARGKDQFLLIGAGIDREFGTRDDQFYP